MADSFKFFRTLDYSETSSIYSDTLETERFCRMFNCLFDCLNTRNLYEGEHKRNENLNAYTSKDDHRLKVITGCCDINYANNSGLKMTLSPIWTSGKNMS